MRGGRVAVKHSEVELEIVSVLNSTAQTGISKNNLHRGDVHNRRCVGGPLAAFPKSLEIFKSETSGVLKWNIENLGEAD